MKSHELIKNHEGIIFFYPFSGSHFEIIKELKNLATVFNEKALFVYCSFGGYQEEYENFTNDNQSIARGLFTDVDNIENKLGLKSIEISSSQKLTDTNFDASYYTFDDTELIFVKGEAFHYIDNLLNEGIDIYKLNLILSYAQGFDEVLKSLILRFSQPQAIGGINNGRKMITVHNHYLNDVKELLSDSEYYRWLKEFKEASNNEYFSILFEKFDDFISQNLNF